MGRRKKNRNNKSNPRPKTVTTVQANPSITKPAWASSAFTFLVGLGFRYVAPNADSPAAVYFGWFVWAISLALFAAGFWHKFKWRIWVKAGAICLSAILFLWAARWNISERLKPSYVFISPSGFLEGDRWMFLPHHRGSKSSFNVQILFEDNDRENYLIRTKASLTSADFSSFEMLWSLPEVNPMGRGTIFAPKLIWQPYNLNLSHFTAEITWRDGNAHEEIQIARVQDRWQYAMKVINRDSGQILIRCHDKDFPSSEVLPPCFPDVINEHD
jgi:hypothetical protein